MRKITAIISILLLIDASLFAQKTLYVHMTDQVNVGMSTSAIDSVSFNEEGSLMYIRYNGALKTIPTAEIDSISFAETSSEVSVYYNGSTAYVVNPLESKGVSVTISGADVTITSTTDTKDITYSLSGTSTDGMFKIYSEKRFNLVLNGLNLTNSDGPAINSQSENKITIQTVYGTSNYLTDGTGYAGAVINSDGEAEDQKAVLFSEGKMVFEGSGSLTVSGNGTTRHGICSDDLIVVDGGTIAINSSARDGLHAGDGLEISGGNITSTATGDCFDGGDGYVSISGGKVTATNTTEDTKGITCDSTLTITGGEVEVSMTGSKSKGLRSTQAMALNGGTINITTSGGVVLETSGSGYNPAYSAAIKCDTLITVDGADITIKSTGTGGKGISSDTCIVIRSGNVNITTTGAGATYKDETGTTDSYNATCLTSDGNIDIIGGTVIAKSSGSAGKGITVDGALTIGDGSTTPSVSVTTTGSKITISSSSNGGGGGGGGWPGGGGGGPAQSSGDYNEAKAIKADGAVTINSGTTTISSADDGIKSTTSVTINNGTLSINNSVEAIESPLITVNDGTVSLTASDDGFNATKGNGGESNDGSLLSLNGGNVTVNVTGGDGLDSNGSIAMSGGTVVVLGPQSSPEVGIDYNGTFNISGGFLVATGPNSGNMIQATSTSSSQYAIKATTSSALSSSTLFHIQDGSGTDLVTFKPVRSTYYVVFSSPELKSGSTYYIYTGGSSSGSNNNGLYSGGSYSGGTLKKSFSVSSKVSTVSF